MDRINTGHLLYFLPMENVVSIRVNWCVALVYLTMEVEIWVFYTYNRTYIEILFLQQVNCRLFGSHRGRKASAQLLFLTHNPQPASNTLSDSQRKKLDMLASIWAGRERMVVRRESFWGARARAVGNIALRMALVEKCYQDLRAE